VMRLVLLEEKETLRDVGCNGSRSMGLSIHRNANNSIEIVARFQI
jgi:hypothetical protein